MLRLLRSVCRVMNGRRSYALRRDRVGRLPRGEAHLVPHSDKNVDKCPYCGYPLKAGQFVCPAHADLVRLEPLDDRYTLTEDDDR